MVVRVEDFMTKKVITIEATKTILEAAKTLTQQNVGSLVVVRGAKPVGIVTDRDIVTRAVVEEIPLDEEKVERVMSKPVITVKLDTPMLEAVELMEKHSVRRIPVVKGETIVGIVTSSDVGRASKILAPYLLPRIPEIYLLPKKRGDYKSVD
jgi:CBS domain-containing protein